LVKSKFWSILIASVFWLVLPSAAVAAEPPQGTGRYEDFVALFDEFRAARLPSAWNANFNDPASPDHGLMDYSRGSIDARLERLRTLRARLDDLNVAAWPREQQSEYLAVRALFDEHASRP